MARPRSEEAQQRALRAAVDVVAEVGVSNFTVDAVVSRSGVAKSTIYRSWSSGDDLLMAALECSIEAIATPNSGSLRQDLIELYTAVTAMMAQPEMFSTILGALARSATDPEFHQLLKDLEHERHRPIRTVLQLAQARGEIDPEADLELLTDFVEGPMAARKILRLDTFTSAEIEQVADLVVRALTT